MLQRYPAWVIRPMNPQRGLPALPRRSFLRLARYVCLCIFLAATGWTADAERSDSAIRVDSPDFREEHIRSDVETLASEAFGGRALGSDGAEKTARFIEVRFRHLGLEPAPGVGYQQQFPVRLQLKLSDGRQNEVSLGGPASRAQWELHRDFLPLPFSGNGRIKDAAMVFAGYAIYAPELGYDDFAGIDVRGKVVIAFRREPQEGNARSQFDGLEFTRHASFAAKARAVAERGGKALLIVSNRLPADEDAELPAFGASAGPGITPIPVLMVRAASVAPFFTEQGLSLNALQRGIEQTGKPASVAFSNLYRIALSVKIEGVNAKGANVLAWLPGDPSNGEYVIVGAHFDHVGRGERFSMDGNGKGKLHPGADDNASGVAALLELARVAKLRQQTEGARGRSVLFVAFGGEEHGLFGSSFYLHQQPLPGRKLVGMLNFDMVGRLREDEIFTAGLDSVPELRQIARDTAALDRLDLKSLSEYPYNMSDHGTFLDAGIPAVLLFTGLHMEYHTPRDTADRINAQGTLRVLGMANTLLGAMQDPASPLRFQGGANPAFERPFREATTAANPFDFE